MSKTTTTTATTIVSITTAANLKPSKAYLDIVKKESMTLNEAHQGQLLILDLNGTLVSRNRKNKSMYVRPFAQPFFDYIFANFTVMLWSSAQPHSVNYMSRIFGSRRSQLDLVWDRTSFQLNKRDFNRKVTTIKDLDKVWRHYAGRFDATNTILLDDSPKKTVLQPYNAIHPTEFEHFSPTFKKQGESELLHVLEYLKKCQFQSNISNFIQCQPYTIDLETRKSENTFLLEYYVFADEFEKKPVLVDFSPKDKKEEDVLVNQLKQVKI